MLAPYIFFGIGLFLMGLYIYSFFFLPQQTTFCTVEDKSYLENSPETLDALFDLPCWWITVTFNNEKVDIQIDQSLYSKLQPGNQVVITWSKTRLFNQFIIDDCKLPEF